MLFLYASQLNFIILLLEVINILLLVFLDYLILQLLLHKLNFTTKAAKLTCSFSPKQKEQAVNAPLVLNYIKLNPNPLPQFLHSASKLCRHPFSLKDDFQLDLVF